MEGINHLIRYYDNSLRILLSTESQDMLQPFIAVKKHFCRPGYRGTMINTFGKCQHHFYMPLNVALFGNKALPYFLIYYIITVSTWTLGVLPDVWR